MHLTCLRNALTASKTVNVPTTLTVAPKGGFAFAVRRHEACEMNHVGNGFLSYQLLQQVQVIDILHEFNLFSLSGDTSKGNS
jgi:hypothetical protein